MLCHQTTTSLGLVGALLEELPGKCMVLSVERNNIPVPDFLRISAPVFSFSGNLNISRRDQVEKEEIKI